MPEGNMPVENNRTPELPSPKSFEEKVKGLIYSEKGKEVEIKDENVQHLARVALLPSSKNLKTLDQILDRGNDMVMDKDPSKRISLEDWAKLAGVIGEEKERLAQTSGHGSIRQARQENPHEDPVVRELKKVRKAVGESATQIGGLNLSEIERDKGNPELQRQKVREVLDKIEANTYPLDHQINAHNYQQLADALKNQHLSPEVAKEVQARLRLHACYTLVERVSGRPEDFVNSMRDIVKEMTVRGLLLEGEDLEYLYKESDLGISRAHAVLERTAFEGARSVGVDDKGKPIRYAGRMSSDQAGRMDEFIRSELGGDTPEIRKAVTLAERLAHATFEYSLWKEVNAQDPITKAAYFSEFRRTELKTGGDFGPAITLELIDGFATSYLRRAAYANKAHLFNEQKWQEAGRLNKMHKMRDAMDVVYKITCIRKLMGKTGRPDDQTYADFHLDTSAPNYKNLPGGSYAVYLAVYLPSVVNTSVNLLKSDYKPSDTTEDNAVSWIGAAMRADTTETPDPPDIPDANIPAYPTKEIFRLRYYLALGIVEEATRQATLLTWDAPQMGTFLNMLQRPVGIDPETRQPFMLITPTQIDKIVKIVHPYRRLAINSAVATLEKIVRTRGG
ncbi:MAG TPA: hypothetical protein VF185_02130 [Patescibacteria group bacterium]